MSGQPYRYASDPAKFRDEYMKTIRLQSDINTMNLDANKAFKATGQLPAVSQMPETRTTSEILADQQKIRMSLMEDLKPLGSPNFASDIIQAIQRSPLNVDGSLFIFFAQRAPEIVTNVKKQYKYGIKGDKNDVAQFVFFVEDMYNKTKSFSSSVKTYFNRPADGNLLTGAISIGDLESIRKLYEEVMRKLFLAIREYPSKTEGYRGPSGTEKLPSEISREAIQDIAIMIDDLADTLTKAEYIANTRVFIDTNTKLINYPQYSEVADIFSDLYKRYSETIENFPKATTLYSLISKLDESAKNKNFKLMNDIVELILGQLTPGLNGFVELNQRLEEARENLDEAMQYIQRYATYRSEEGEEFIEKESVQGKVKVPESIQGIPASIQERINEYQKREQEDELLLRKQYGERQRRKDENTERVQQPRQPDDMEGLTLVRGEELVKEQDDPKKIEDRIITLEYTQRELEKILEEKKKGSKLYEMYMKLKEDNDVELEELRAKLTKLRGGYEEAKGSGIKKRGRGRPRGSGVGTAKTFKDSFLKHKDDTVGIDESPRYVKFGRYFLNTHKLKGTGMLTLRRQGGGNISELPSSRVSTNLSDIVFKMVGGGVPTYQELSKLSEPEKAYLHKISTKANIIDKFSIPAPDKDRAEKDIHDFEVMKGEILAGNDSKELIKKFKLHLIKLSKNGTLPKGEVQEIMEELIQLGF